MDAIKRILLICLVCVTALASQAQTAVASSAHTYVFLLAGQSNMAGRGKPQLQDTTVVSNIYMLNAAMQWVPAREPLHFDKPAIVGVGPGFAFAREIMRKDQQAIIYLIPAAVGVQKLIFGCRGHTIRLPVPIRTIMHSSARKKHNPLHLFPPSSGTRVRAIADPIVAMPISKN